MLKIPSEHDLSVLSAKITHRKHTTVLSEVSFTLPKIEILYIIKIFSQSSLNNKQVFIYLIVWTCSGLQLIIIFFYIVGVRGPTDTLSAVFL